MDEHSERRRWSGGHARTNGTPRRPGWKAKAFRIAVLVGRWSSRLRRWLRSEPYVPHRGPDNGSAPTADHVADGCGLPACGKPLRRGTDVRVHLTGAGSCLRVEIGAPFPAEPFLTIRFDEHMDRERFLDWFRWQTGRLPLLEEEVAQIGEAEVRRRLIHQMLDDEAAARRRDPLIDLRRPLLMQRAEG